ncbi:SDR family oxidoreductase [Devosia ginsengisoli]|uniref:SDR family oxidoreductase n=1 Tax=Devosia ginsengisoli TaxID=400770 RepID=A0A5B8LVK6_9HYPH|nr:SDR family oxidoreductase [Devosia ginsengisoli]QDZ11625.1 SDR family oxidoreductase [Devosia ginsengisoli]
MPDLFNLSGKIAMVTGGAGILGHGFCQVLAEHGAAVALVDLSRDAADNAARQIRDAVPGATILPVECDVADSASVAAAVDTIVGQLGGIDILHNNAATKSGDLNAFFEPFETFDPSIWREIMGVNIDGMFLVAQAVGRQMLAQGRGGSMIKTASIYGVVAPDQRIYEGSNYMGRAINTPAVYSASKAAVIGLARYLATYWAEAGIRVNVLTPGGIESGQNDVFRTRYANRVPLGRMGADSELHGALIYLASDASSYVTGQNLIVDGGLSAW